jgi:uroporphyrinogen III methyltransferase/synthase
VAPAYKTIRPRKDVKAVAELLKAGEVDVVTFISSSTVTNFVKMLGKKGLPGLLKGVKVACIGPVTAQTARGFGLKVDIMPKEYTIPGLARAMADYYS